MIQRLSFACLLLALPGLVFALGLGRLELQSNLNESFEARIQLIEPSVDELASLKVLLADQAAFQRAGIPHAAVLRHLRFEVIEPQTGPDYVRIYSDEPIREPFLNFLLELNWSKGRLFREYTVLLDPPIYAAKQQRLKTTKPAPTPATDTGEPQSLEDNNVVYNPEYKPSAPSPVTTTTPPPATPVDYSGGDYGPVEAGNTLWSLASAMRPDTSISVQQMMLALLRANPEAFINNNINGLKRGAILRMPDQSELTRLSESQAFAEAKQQNLAWDGAAPEPVTTRPEGAPETATTAEPAETVTPDAPAESDPELRLVAPTDEGEGATGAGEPTTEKLTQELALVNESLEALKQENVELQDKLIESEAIVDDLRRLIVLKEEELAALQQQIAASEAAATADAAETEPEVAEPTPEAVPEEEPVVPVEPAPSDAAPEETVAEETVPAVEEPADMAEAEVTAPEKSLLARAKDFITTIIPASTFDNLITAVRNNLLIIGGAIGGLLLLILGVGFVKNRQSSKATVIPESDLQDYEDMEDTVAASDAEDSTDINPELAVSEDATDQPAADEGDLGEFDLTADEEDDAATRIAAPPSEPEDLEATTTEKPAAAAAEIADEDEDRLAEVNVFLAYEHFDQAADFVKDAIAEQPDNLEYHSKLLEVYYAAGDKKNYESAARELHDKVNGEGEYWDMAVAMWQEMSPNRALFAEPVAGEEEEAGEKAEGGGIVNIAGDEGTAASGLDFDLDTTADSDTDETPVEGDEEADVLDVTAAVSDDEDDGVLDLTSVEEDTGDAAEKEDEGMLNITGTDEEDSRGGDEDLDFSFGDTGDSDSLDFSLGDTADSEDTTEESDAGLDISLGDSTDSDSGDTDALDFSIGADDASTDDEEQSDGLDISLGDTGDDSSLDISVDQTEESTDSRSDDGMDISLGDTGDDDSSLDISVDQAGASTDSSADDGLDISLGDTGDDSPLDISVEPPEQSSTDVDDNSLDFSITGSESGEHDPLDVTSSMTTDEAGGEDLLDVSSHSKDEDPLDVTTSGSYESEEGEDLLNVTTSTTDAGDLAGSDKQENEGDDGGIDFDNGSMDKTPDEEGDLDLDIDIPDTDDSGEESDMVLDVTGGTEDSGGGLDLEFSDDEDEPQDDSGMGIDMDSTMEIPKSGTATGGKLELEDTSGDESIDTDTSGFELEIDADEEDDEDDDHTVFVGRSSDTEEQSEDDEIATQLDLAKAYIELGDTDNAKTILNEVVSVGNDEQRKQAEELLSQV